MSKIWVIATNTVRQTIRQRLFLNVAIFGLGMVLFSMVVAQITYGYPDRTVRSIGLSGVSIAVTLMGLLLSVTLVYQEIDKKTLFVIFTRPISRTQYVIGRYLGLLITLALVTLGFSMVFISMLSYVGGQGHSADMFALLGSFLQASIISSVGLLLSCFSTPSLSTGIGLGFWIVSASTDDLVALTTKADATTQTLAKALYYISPNLSRFSFREEAIYDIAINYSDVTVAILYCVLYSIGLVILSGLVLERREMV